MKTDPSEPVESTSGRKPIWVFTPSRTDPKDLEFILVQRQELLKDAVERVRESALTEHKHHLLFVGPRGCGKTHLVTLVVSRLGEDAEVADRLRIAWLNEDETCTTLLELLLKIHAALEKRYPDEYRADMLDAAFELKSDLALDYVATHLLASLGSRTLVVLAENLDAIFEGLGDSGQKQLRAFIQENPKLSIVATAQRLVEDLSNRAGPFFGFFQTEHLKPLKVEEATELLQNIARLHGQCEVVEFLATSRGHSRVRALHHLAGGNHRIYIVLSQFITRDSIDALVGPFMKMVDELTPYYQERIRWLPAQQRKIVEYLCGCDGTVPVKDIAKRLFATPQTISGQLQDLRDKGYVEASQRGRESLYEISEPLMRICVEVKDNQGHKPLRLLVDFLRVWYDDQELRRRFQAVFPENFACAYFKSAIQRNCVEGNLRKRLILKEIQSSLLFGFSQSVSDSIVEHLADLSEFAALAVSHLKDGKSDEAVACMSDALAEEKEPANKAKLLLLRAWLPFSTPNSRSRLDDYTAVIGLAGAPLDAVTTAHLLRGMTLDQLDQRQRAMEDYTAVIQLTGASTDAVAMALINRGMTLDLSGERFRAIDDYTTLIELANAPVELQVDALVNRGIAYYRGGELPQALKDYSVAIAHRGALPRQVAEARITRGMAKAIVDDLSQAVEDFTAVLGLADAPEGKVAEALFNRGMVYLRQDRKAEAAADFEHLISIPGTPAKMVNKAYLALAEVHASEGRWKSAFKFVESSLGLCSEGDTVSQASISNLVGVLFNAGLSKKGRQDKAAQFVNIYSRRRSLAILGESVIQHLGSVCRSGEPLPSADNLEGWVFAWGEAAKQAAAFQLPMRLLRVGVDFVKSGKKDPGVLLQLTSTERTILQQVLGLTKQEDEG